MLNIICDLIIALIVKQTKANYDLHPKIQSPISYFDTNFIFQT